MKTNNQGRYSAKARRVSTPRATVTPRSSAAPGAAAPRQGPAPRLAATRSAYTRAEAARPATVQPASAYPRHTRSTQTSAVAGSAPLKAVLAAFAGVALLAGLAYGYFTFWRSVPRHGQRRGSPGAHPFVRRGRPQGQQLLRRQARPPALGWRQRAQGGRRRALLRHAGRR